MRGAAQSLTAFLFLLSVPAFADPVIPDTNAGRPFKLWLQIMNSGDPGLTKQYDETYHRNLTPEAVESFYTISGGYRLKRIEQNQPNRLVAILTERDTGDEVRRTFAVDPADPTHFLEATQEILQPVRLSQAEALKAISNRAGALAAKDFFSGGILIAQNGKILLEKTWGFSDRATKKPVTRNTQFRMGSMNKMFTAIAALQLVAQEKLSLDGTVGTFLPDYPNKEIASKVTIRMLLSHTGGTGDFFGPEFDAHRLSLKENADYVALFGSRAPDFPPGNQDRYSNYGFILLGHIIQIVSGMSYYDYVQQNIFATSGMTATGSLPEMETVLDRSIGYMRQNGKWISNADTLPWRGTAAGGGYSTLSDMLKFAETLRTGKLLPAGPLAEAISPHDHAGGYGYGFGVRGKDALRQYGHTGGAPGMNGDLRIYPALGRVVVAFSNLDPPTATAMTEYYEQRMPLN